MPREVPVCRDPAEGSALIVAVGDLKTADVGMISVIGHQNRCPTSFWTTQGQPEFTQRQIGDSGQSSLLRMCRLWKRVQKLLKWLLEACSYAFMMGSVLLQKPRDWGKIFELRDCLRNLRDDLSVQLGLIVGGWILSSLHISYLLLLCPAVANAIQLSIIIFFYF